MIRCAFRSADRGLAIKRREGAEGYRDRNHGTRMMISSGRHERISFHRVLMEEESRCIRLIAPLNNSSGIQINNVSRERLLDCRDCFVRILYHFFSGSPPRFFQIRFVFLEFIRNLPPLDNFSSPVFPFPFHFQFHLSYFS